MKDLMTWGTEFVAGDRAAVRFRVKENLNRLNIAHLVSVIWQFD